MTRVLLASLLVFATVPLAAQESQVQLDRFRASETAEDLFQLSRPLDLGHIGFSAQLHIDYAHDPLVYEARLGDAETERGAIVAHQVNATFGAAFGIADRLVVYTGLPVVLAMTGDDGPFGQTPIADGPGMGDIYLGARVRILGEHDALFAMAAQITGTFPTGGGSYRGDNSLSVHPELLFEVRPSQLYVTFNLGARIRDDANFPGGEGVKVGDELTWGVGLGVPIYGSAEPGRTHLDLAAQAYGALGFNDFFGRNTSTGEAVGGVKLFHRTGVTVGVVAGGGFLRGFGNPEARAVAQVGYATPRSSEVRRPDAPEDVDGDGLIEPEDACADQPEDFDGFQDEDGCPDPDDDQDGIFDVDDECPREAEDPDGFSDDDGCPDLDDDEDGIPDADDECKEQTEDLDGFEDEDGCPEADNDQDGVTDEADRCPLQAGPVANYGCPDIDRDEDGVVDRLDNCPDEPGTEANHGCRERQQVVLREGRLEILDKVYFRTGRARIRGRSFALLRNVAQVLENHPEIMIVRVEGHTDSEGDDASNLELSQARAESVRAFLVREGVEEGRLRAQGFGESRPRESNDTATGRAANRRVEFNLGEPEPTGETGAEPASGESE